MVQKNKNFLLVDTCIYIQCSLFTEKKSDEKILNDLLSLMDKGDLFVLLPDIITWEYNRKLSIALGQIKNSLDGLRSLVGDKIPSPQIKDELIKAIQDALAKREDNVKKAEKLIDKIFKHKNTINIPISPDTLVAAYKRGILGLKPFKIPGKDSQVVDFIQPDCLILEAVRNFLSNEKKFNFYICTDNTSDFAMKKDKSALKIHPDIEKEFPKASLYTRLHELLNDKFNSKIKEKELTLSEVPSWLGGVSKIENYLTIDQCRKCGKRGSLGVSINATSGLCLSCELFQGTAVAIGNACSKCGAVSPFMNPGGLCNNCMISGYDIGTIGNKCSRCGNYAFTPLNAEGLCTSCSSPFSLQVCKECSHPLGVSDMVMGDGVCSLCRYKNKI